jgi:hypothetical protein
MSLLFLLLALTLVFGGGGFCCGGPSGGMLGLVLMLFLVGRFALGLQAGG